METSEVAILRSQLTASIKQNESLLRSIKWREIANHELNQSAADNARLRRCLATIRDTRMSAEAAARYADDALVTDAGLALKELWAADMYCDGDGHQARTNVPIG